MGTHTMNKKSWESLSSTFSNLEISVSQDSCYASDEVSLSSSNSIPASTLLGSSFAPVPEAALRPFLKSILKRPYADIAEDEESESGYGTDDSEYDYAALSDAPDDDDDEIYEVSIWGEESDVSDVMSEICSDDGSVDGSFISFESESIVRFDSNIRYIEAPEPQEEEVGMPRAEMTCHELMEMARASGTLRLQAGLDHGNRPPEYDDMGDSIEQWPEEHPNDILELDKRLFVAYINGLNGVSDPKYKARLRQQVDDIRKGNAQSPYLESDSAQGKYLDNVLNHVLGTFRNILVQDELDELATLGDPKGALQQQDGAREALDKRFRLQEKIEHLLTERLAGDEVVIGQDELSFFAGGVAYAFQNWATYVSH